MPRGVTVHGAAANNSTTAEYRAWVGIQARCSSNPAGKYFRTYSQAGIRVAPEWTGSNGFTQFLSYVGLRLSPSHKLQRYPQSNGNYEPGNVRWATQVQINQNKGDTKLHTHDGITLSIAEWGRVLKIAVHLLHRRLAAGLSIADALLVPTEPRGTNTHCWRGHAKETDKRCAKCARSQDVFKKIRVRLATPPWLTKDQRKTIATIYSSRPAGYHVDHEIPLRGKTVCGLHVPWNLRIIPAFDNLSKGNRVISQQPAIQELADNRIRIDNGKVSVE